MASALNNSTINPFQILIGVNQRTPPSRIVVDTQKRYQRGPSRSARSQTSPEVWVAISVIVAAALATFVALFLTSRPFDPMNASVEPQQVVPAGPNISPTPKGTATVTPTPELPNLSPQSIAGGETTVAPPDDAAIQSNIERTFASDPTLSGLDVSTLVENGKVTVVGSVKSAELKQRVERAVRAVKGVLVVDNQLVVTEATPL